jgi:hypothetical protein
MIRATPPARKYRRGKSDERGRTAENISETGVAGEHQSGILPGRAAVDKAG